VQAAIRSQIEAIGHAAVARGGTREFKGGGVVDVFEDGTTRHRGRLRRVLAFLERNVCPEPFLK
jgi:hypothetical protein